MHPTMITKPVEKTGLTPRLRRRIALYSALVLHYLPHAKEQIRAWCRQNITLRRPTRPWSVMLFVLMSIGLMGPSSCGGCDGALLLPGIPEVARDLLIQ